jgi:predicted CXXCH cytochrome family protein
MSAVFCTIGLLVAAGLVLAPQVATIFGRRRGIWAGAGFAGVLALAWSALDRSTTRSAPIDWAAVPSVASDSCAKCHADHFESWQRTYHRSMTREATPENVRGDFDNAVHDYQGLPTRFTRTGDTFQVETIDPGWAAELARAHGDRDKVAAPRFATFKIDRLVGSHWIQECLHKLKNGTYIRMPVLYHIGEKRWIHTNGAFLAPDTDDFWQKSRDAKWNETCLFCHNTGPRKNLVLVPGQESGYATQVAELGISCEACHGPGGEHVSRNQNPAHRFDLQLTGTGDSSIVNPVRLSVPRRDEICARCHGALVPKREMWDPIVARDPFIPGFELGRFNYFFTSELEQARLYRGGQKDDPPPKPEPTDGRFWGDGTPLTTALEYNGMALSACYQKGRGSMSCLSCHEMHGTEPNHMLKPGMRTNEACYQCHDEYRASLAEHTKHPADSPGSLCFNCHMPRVVYSLLATHRSHRIESPTLEGSMGSGKPHACNLCHLDKSLGWTRDQLTRWPGGRKEIKLSKDEERVAASLLCLLQGDARTRVVVAGAFEEPAAHRASRTDWYGSFLTRVLKDERYPAVRYLAHKSLRAVYGDPATRPYDFLGRSVNCERQLQMLRERFDARPVADPLPYIPLTSQGLPDDQVLRRLRDRRTDPDLTINE